MTDSKEGMLRSCLGLTQPTDHADAYTWAAVLTAHAAIGMVLVVELHNVMALYAAVSAAWVGYLLFWEGLVQRFGAGLLDALTDAAAVTSGVVYGAGTFFGWPGVRWAALVLFAGVLAAGVWRRQRA